MDGDLSDKQVPLVTTSNGNGGHRENGYVTNIDNADRFGFTNLPYRESIDLQFKDITYTVKMGWNKGKRYSFFTFTIFVLVPISGNYSKLNNQLILIIHFQLSCAWRREISPIRATHTHTQAYL